MSKKIISLGLSAVVMAGSLLSFNNAVQAQTVSTAKSTAAVKQLSAATYTLTKEDYYSVWSEHGYSTLKRGSQGDDVTALQMMLNAIHSGYGIGIELVEDGKFGSKTESMVRTVQGYVGAHKGTSEIFSAISQDGVVGPYTWGKILIAQNL